MLDHQFGFIEFPFNKFPSAKPYSSNIRVTVSHKLNLLNENTLFLPRSAFDLIVICNIASTIWIASTIATIWIVTTGNLYFPYHM